MKNKDKIAEILNHQEALVVINQVENSITKNLVNTALHFLLTKYMRDPTLPDADIDLKFFAEALLQFCSNHKLIQEILEEKDIGP